MCGYLRALHCTRSVVLARVRSFRLSRVVLMLLEENPECVHGLAQEIVSIVLTCEHKEPCLIGAVAYM